MTDTMVIREVGDTATTREQDLRLAWDRMRTMVFDDNRRAEVSAAVGLSFVKVKALRRLLVRPMSMRELAAELVIDKPYLTQIVDALEKRGLVVRRVSPHDRRCRIVSLTESGHGAAQRSEEILTRPPAFLDVLSDGELGQLTRILAKLPMTGDGEPS